MEKEHLPVLSVKYKIPTPRSNYIIREGLMKSLDQMKEKPVTILKAGAGSGKTTLLSVYIKENNLKHLYWITMDAGMNQVFLFLKYLFGALESELKEHRESLRSCFEDSIQKEMLETVLAAFADQLHTEHPIYLVMDDFQCITDRYLLEIFRMFLRLAPENLHVILLTRQLPEISMGSLFMEGRLLLISEEDMRLTREECRKFLVNTLGIKGGDRTDQYIEDIINNANGWIGGAQLMAITGQGGEQDHTLFSSADEGVVNNYMEREIYAALSQEEQQFLLKTAVLSYFNDEICSRYIPEYNFSYMIRQISEKNLFVILLDQEKKEYRYHAILREFLLRLLDQKPERKAQLYKRAAEISYELQDYDECVRLLFESREYELLTRLLMKMPQNGTTFNYMMQVPLNQAMKTPDFAYQYFFCYYAALDVEKCEEIYRYIKQNFKEDQVYQAFSHVNMFFDARCEFSDIAIMSYEQINAMPVNQVSKAYLLIKEAYFLFMMDKGPEALRYLDEAEKIYRETNNIYIQIFYIAEKTQIMEEYGEFTEGLKLYEVMKDMLKEVPTMKCSYYIGLAGLHIRQLRIAEAGEELKKAEEAMNWEGEALRGAYLYTLAEWYFVSGSPEKTEEIIMELTSGGMYQDMFFSARLLRYPVYRERNKELAGSFQENYNKSRPMVRNMDMELLHAGIEYEIGDREKAAGYVDQLLKRARKSGNRVKIIEGTLMKARILYEQGVRGVRITNLLAEAVEYAFGEKIRLPFWFEREFLGMLLKEEKEIEKVLSRPQLEFLIKITGGKSDNTKKPGLPYDLTEREMEVLQEIAEGHTNKEIAETLCISMATVKTHLINIYGKLGVNNRMAAVNKLGEFVKREKVVR